MPRVKLAEKLFRYLWYRFVGGKSEEEASKVTGISAEVFEEHRAKRTPQYVEAERRLDEAIPGEMLVAYAKAAQLRALCAGSDSTAASVAAKVIERAGEGAERPASISFVVTPFGEEAQEMQASGEESKQEGDEEQAVDGSRAYVAVPVEAKAHVLRLPVAAARAAEVHNRKTVETYKKKGLLEDAPSGSEGPGDEGGRSWDEGGN